MTVRHHRNLLRNIHESPLAMIGFVASTSIVREVGHSIVHVVYPWHRDGVRTEQRSVDKIGPPVGCVEPRDMQDSHSHAAHDERVLVLMLFAQRRTEAVRRTVFAGEHVVQS